MLGRSPDIRWHHSQQSFWFTSELVISWRSKKIAHVSSSNHSSEKIEGQRAKGKGQRAKGKNHKLIFSQALMKKVMSLTWVPEGLDERM